MTKECTYYHLLITLDFLAATEPENCNNTACSHVDKYDVDWIKPIGDGKKNRSAKPHGSNHTSGVWVLYK